MKSSAYDPKKTWKLMKIKEIKLKKKKKEG